MAAYGRLEHIFEKPIQENPTLLESLSPWKQMKSVELNLEDSSCTEIFGELHFKENNDNHVLQSPSSVSSLPLSSPSSSTSTSSLHQEITNEMSKKEKSNSPYHPNRKQYRHSDSFSSMNSESLSLCTEGLGFESSDDVEELKNENICLDFQSHQNEKISSFKNSSWKQASKRSRTSKGTFPPPISSIGRTGKPWVCFKSHKEDGRFILQEIRIPTQEFLHACREDGRLKLQFIQSDDEILEGNEEEEDGLAADEKNICDFEEFNNEENGKVDGENDDEQISSHNDGG